MISQLVGSDSGYKQPDTNAERKVIFYENLGMLITNVIILTLTMIVTYNVFKLTKRQNTRLNILFISMNVAYIISGVC